MDEAQRVGGLILKAGQDTAIVLQSGKQAPDFRPVPNQAVGLGGGEPPGESGRDQGDFIRCSRGRVDGARQTIAVCHRHELRTLARLGRSPVRFFRPDEGGIAETLAEVHLAPGPYLLGPRFQAAPQDARPPPLLEAALARLVGGKPLR